MSTQIQVHLTASYQLAEADKLIAKLRQQHGADMAYIQELEDKNEELQNEYNKVINDLKKLRDKYSDDVMQVIRTDILYEKYKKNLESVKQERDQYKKQRDALAYRLTQLQNV